MIILWAAMNMSKLMSNELKDTKMLHLNKCNNNNVDLCVKMTNGPTRKKQKPVKLKSEINHLSGFLQLHC